MIESPDGRRRLPEARERSRSQSRSRLVCVRLAVRLHSAARMLSTATFSTRTDDVDELVCRIDEIKRYEPYAPRLRRLQWLAITPHYLRI